MANNCVQFFLAVPAPELICDGDGDTLEGGDCKCGWSEPRPGRPAAGKATALRLAAPRGIAGPDPPRAAPSARWRPDLGCPRSSRCLRSWNEFLALSIFDPTGVRHDPGSVHYRSRTAFLVSQEVASKMNFEVS